MQFLEFTSVTTLSTGIVFEPFITFINTLLSNTICKRLNELMVHKALKVLLKYLDTGVH